MNRSRVGRRPERGGSDRRTVGGSSSRRASLKRGTWIVGLNPAAARLGHGDPSVVRARALSASKDG